MSTLIMLMAQAISASCLVLQIQALPKIDKLPTITNSVVNLGKIDVSVYVNPADDIRHSSTLRDICDCNQMQHFLKNPHSNGFKPSNFLNKLLLSNDLFTYHKEPVKSGMCCDSPAHQSNDDQVVWFELTGSMPPQPEANQIIGEPPLFFSFDTEKKQASNVENKAQTKTKKKDMSAMINEEIKKVGDKAIESVLFAESSDVKNNSKQSMTTQEAEIAKVDPLAGNTNNV